MSITMHSASVPIFVRTLGNLIAWLDKAEAHAEAKKFEPAVYLGTRLAPDLLPFTKQIQLACDSVNFVVVGPRESELGKWSGTLNLTL